MTSKEFKALHGAKNKPPNKSTSGKKNQELKEQKQAPTLVPELELLNQAAKEAGIELRGSYVELGCSPLKLQSKDGRDFEITIKELKK